MSWSARRSDTDVRDLLPSHPAAGKAGIARLFATVYHFPGLPEPGRSAFTLSREP